MIASFVDLPFVQRAAAASGLPADMLVMIALLFLPFFIAPIYRFLGSAQVRYAFDIIVGSVFLIGLYGPANAVHFYGLCAVALVLMHTTGKNAPPLVYAISFGYLSYRHIARYFRVDASYDVDVTGPMMILVLKVISMAFNFRDGGMPTEGTKAKPERASLFATLGYLMHHSTLIAGPPLRLDEYTTYTALKPTDTPSPVLVSVGKFVAGLGWFGLHVWAVVLATIDVNVLSNPETAFTYPLWQRLVLLHYFVFTARIKFYAAWLVGEAALNLAGWGFNTKTKEWSEVCNVHPLRTELGNNARNTILNWNIRVSEWLRAYVLEKAPYSRDTNTLLAFLVSAAWHGFSATHYAFFLGLGFYMLKISRLARKAYHPIAVSLGPVVKGVYDVVGTFINMFVFCYIGTPWVCADMTQALAVWRNTYFAGHVLCVISWIVSTIIIANQPKAPKPTKKE
eukprot:c27172_g1_i1.p1 GENE.c27172_g1_i1~~c27172_g1_i1.p1  ORF type:complete len:453 (+),score=101.67 c27172_g1_i1:51-1409(+)